MNFRTRTAIFAILIFATLAWAGVKPSIPNAAQLQIQLKKLLVVGNALYVGAHPDDENSAVLAYLSEGKMVHAAYLSLTRGEGGQNLIGTEQGDLLGMIRTQELLAARDLDHAQQFFTRAIDFGFSKSPDESLKIWGKENILSDVVWVIRKFRPDVILCRFATDGSGGHGHHTASAILAQEAFDAAADPKRFPDQLRYLAPWKAKRIVWNRATWTQQPTETEAAAMIRLDVGVYNPYLGLSYPEMAGMSRSMHKSQGTGDSEDRGPEVNFFKPIAGDASLKDLFDGIDLTWKRVPNSADIVSALEEANQAFRPDNPQASLPALIKAYQLMKAFPSNPWVEEKKPDVLQAIQACAGLWLEAIAAEDSAIPGSEIKIATSAMNRSDFPLKLETVELAANKTEPNAALENNHAITGQIVYRIPETTEISQPYWLNGNPESPIAEVSDQKLIGLPESNAALQVKFELSASGSQLEFVVPVLFRRVDPVRGEVYRRFIVIPPVALNLPIRVMLFPETIPTNITVDLHSGGAKIDGNVKLKLPPGWTVKPDSIPFHFESKNEPGTASFTIAPTSTATSGIFTAEATVGGHTYNRGIVTIDYPHIPAQTAFPLASGKLVRLNLKTAGKNIAYIMGSGDTVPQALGEIGYKVTLLKPDEIATTDLSGFDAIITGVRLYNTHPEMKSVQPKLLDYVKQGGTMVVQYNTLQQLDQKGLGPYPFNISRDRVSVEDAPITILATDHPLLHHPNEITQDDFSGWIQERGLQFADQWDPQYQTVIACNDPGEPSKRGGILYAKYGKGVYIYTGYSWFRELPAGVPGTFRLFVNLISAKQ